MVLLFSHVVSLYVICQIFRYESAIGINWLRIFSPPPQKKKKNKKSGIQNNTSKVGPLKNCVLESNFFAADFSLKKCLSGPTFEVFFFGFFFGLEEGDKKKFSLLMDITKPRL